MSGAPRHQDHPPEPCWLCAAPTRVRALYTPTNADYSMVYTPGVFAFPICRECAPQLSLGTPAALVLRDELRQLALGGERGRA